MLGICRAEGEVFWPSLRLASAVLSLPKPRVGCGGLFPCGHPWVQPRSSPGHLVSPWALQHRGDITALSAVNNSSSIPAQCPSTGGRGKRAEVRAAPRAPRRQEYSDHSSLVNKAEPCVISEPSKEQKSERCCEHNSHPLCSESGCAWGQRDWLIGRL